jgi:hypothetical protein
MSEAVRMSSCQGSACACVFGKALQSHAAHCSRSARRAVGEREVVECGDSSARDRCSALVVLMHERARFALRLPRRGGPLMHSQAMRLQCGGLTGLRQALSAGHADVQELVDLAGRRDGGLGGLPWDALVAGMRAWVPRRRRPPR